MIIQLHSIFTSSFFWLYFPERCIMGYLVSGIIMGTRFVLVPYSKWWCWVLPTSVSFDLSGKERPMVLVSTVGKNLRNVNFLFWNSFVSLLRIFINMFLKTLAPTLMWFLFSVLVDHEKRCAWFFIKKRCAWSHCSLPHTPCIWTWLQNKWDQNELWLNIILGEI